MRELGRLTAEGPHPVACDLDCFLREEPGDVGAWAGAGEWVSPEAALARAAIGEWLIPAPDQALLAAVAPGLAGVEARVAAAAAALRAAPRLWPLAAGVRACPLRTPTLPPATHTNCYLVGTGEIAVIDPASPFAEEQAALERALDWLVAEGARVVRVLLTHHHLDHVSGAERVARRYRVPIAAHPATAERLRARVAVDEELLDGQRIELGGAERRTLSAVHTPGHAAGHLCFLEEETGFLVAGDMVAGLGTILVDPEEGDMRAYLDSLEKMKALAARRLLPAHGDVLPDPAACLDGYRRHRLWRETRVIEALGELGTASLAELLPRVYGDVEPAIHPLAERSLLAHLLKLEAEGIATREAGGWRRTL